ncbi:hypothetical protein HD554DRAFT_1224195 [Boletus coccyginus]|nr:hypothetical protein HD554DRAFT_1224195 [Boletus coccyginus]
MSSGRPPRSGLGVMSAIVVFVATCKSVTVCQVRADTEDLSNIYIMMSFSRPLSVEVGLEPLQGIGILGKHRIPTSQKHPDRQILAIPDKDLNVLGLLYSQKPKHVVCHFLPTSSRLHIPPRLISGQMRRDGNRRFAIPTRVGSERKSCRSPSEINLLRFQCSLYVYSLARMRVDRRKFIIFIESL